MEKSHIDNGLIIASVDVLNLDNYLDDQQDVVITGTLVRILVVENYFESETDYLVKVEITVYENITI